MNEKISKILISLFILFGYLGENIYAQKSNLAPKYRTKINIDSVFQKGIATKYIQANVIYTNNSRIPEDIRNDDNIFPLRGIVEGSDSTIFILNREDGKLVQFNKDGKFIKSMGKKGNKQGEYYNPFQMLSHSDSTIYICDNMGKRMQVIDLKGNFIREIKNQNFLASGIAFGKNGKIISVPISAMACPIPVNDNTKEKKILPKTKYLVSIWDSLLKTEKRICAVKSNDPDFFDKNMNRSFKVISSENSEYIWVVLQSSPIIRKYDYNGNFIEEIQFTGKSIEKMVHQNRLFKEEYKNSNMSRSCIIIDHALIMPDGCLLINLYSYGNFQLSSKSERSVITKRYKFSIIPENDNIDPDTLNLLILHGKIYGYKVSMIVKEIEN